MKTLTLSIKQEFFDQIKAGTKTFEEREIRPTSMAKYCNLDEDGEFIMDDGIVQTRHYDAIKFLTGEYKGTRPSMTVEIKSSEFILITDDDDEPIFYDFKGEEYVACIIRYELGKILN